jgi:hypothetical protein
MVSFTAAAVSLLLARAGSAHASKSVRVSSSHRSLSFESIAGYEPRSLVTDHNAIDLDQDAMEKQLSLATDSSYLAAKAIYERGAFSKSVATVTLDTALTGPLNKDTKVLGTSVDGTEINGSLLEDIPSGSTMIKIQYDTTTLQSKYVGCQVGANPEPVLDGCFMAQGTLMVGSDQISYSYVPLQNNHNERTLKGFSTQAQEKMYECDNCPYRTYEKFYDYYGVFDYANQWVLAAFEGSSTSFVNGQADFSSYTMVGRTEAIRKGTAYMNVWMYVIREMEDALDDCKEACTIENCNDDPVRAWDEAVAFYTGSLEGQEGSGDGKLLYALANKLCINFNTCGEFADEVEGTAHVNIEIFRQFLDGSRRLLAGECASARANKERIEELMAVPLIQGTLRYAYETDMATQVDEKSDAEGAVFAAAVLPLVHACDKDAADTIYRNMKTGQNGSARFAEVKAAFEKTYSCLKVRCEDVGGRGL